MGSSSAQRGERGRHPPKTFTADNSWIQCMRCSLLGLEAGTTSSREDINASEHFVPQAAALESDLIKFVLYENDDEHCV